jgi:hypothetical protein
MRPAVKKKAMTLLQKLLFENSNNNENIGNILSLAKECAECVKENNSYIESVEVGSDGKVDYTFTHQAIESEHAHVLFGNANAAFLDEFNERVRMELSELFN